MGNGKTMEQGRSEGHARNNGYGTGNHRGSSGQHEGGERGSGWHGTGRRHDSVEHRRILDHPVLGKIRNRETVRFIFDGLMYEGLEGDTIAAALLANGVRYLRRHEETGTPRGIYCNIGHCYECRVMVDGCAGVRACLTLIEEGMEVGSGHVLPTPFAKGEEGL